MKPKKRPFVSLKGSETGKKTKTGRTLYKYKNQPISEKVVDIEMEDSDGKSRIYLIPTVVGDKLYKDPEIPIKMFMNKELKAVHSFPKGNLTPEQIQEKIDKRSKSLLKKYGGKVYTRKAMHDEI